MSSENHPDGGSGGSKTLSGLSQHQETTNSPENPEESAILDMIIQSSTKEATKDTNNSSTDNDINWQQNVEAQIQKSLEESLAQQFEDSNKDASSSESNHYSAINKTNDSRDQDINDAVFNAIHEMNRDIMIQNNNKDHSKPEEPHEKPESSSVYSSLKMSSTSALERLKQISTIEYVRPEQAQLAALPMIITAPSAWPLEEQVSVNSLPLLDNLATQILRIIVSSSYEEIVNLVQPLDQLEDAESEDAHDAESFQALIRLFVIAKSVYTRNVKEFITIDDVAPGIWNSEKETPLFISGKEEIFANTLRKTNLATFICGLVNSIVMEFVELDQNFLDVFCPVLSQSVLSNDNPMKTTATDDIISNVTGYGEAGRLSKSSAALYLDLKTQAYISALLAHQSHEAAAEDLEHLFPENIQSVLCARRREVTLTPIEESFVTKCFQRKKYLRETESIDSLVEKYNFDSFVKSLLTFLKTNLAFIIYGNKIRSSGSGSTLWNASTATAAPSTIDSILNNRGDGYLAQSLLSNLRKRESEADKSVSAIDTSLGYQPAKKQKTAARPKIRTGEKQTRKAWSKEEEAALREGLIKEGPRWNKILDLYGAGGQINEVLKDRSHVSLKDKARNWKMYYLKREIPLPPYLVHVTGEVSFDKTKNGRFLGKKRLELRKQMGEVKGDSYNGDSENHEVKKAGEESVKI